MTEKVIRCLYLCKCGKCFVKRKDFKTHLKRRRAFRKRHYAPDYNKIPFTIFQTRVIK
jgi:hypothetical protein